MASSLRTLWVAALVVATMLSAAHAQNEAQWLAAHNAARSAVDVAPLVWSASAAANAQYWVRTQTARADCPVMQHSDTAGFGENIAAASGSQASPTGVTGMWVAEKQWYNYASNTCSAPAEESCGHYKQVVWRATTSVGCASAPCAATPSIVYYVCNYFPSGNVGDQRPY